MGRKMTEWLIFLVFFITGLAFIIAGISLQLSNQVFLHNAVETSATITNITSYYSSTNKKSHDVEVKFSVDGVVYRGEIGEWHSGMRIGDTTKIYYNRDNPKNFRGGSTSFVGFLFMGFGLIFFLIGGLNIFFMIKKLILYKKLLETGKRIEANITSVSMNYSYSVNRRHPYVINCIYIDPITNKVFSFVSHHIWFDAEAVVRTCGITTIPVYMDENDNSRYYVDVQYIQKYLANTFN